MFSPKIGSSLQPREGEPTMRTGIEARGQVQGRIKKINMVGSLESKNKINCKIYKATLKI